MIVLTTPNWPDYELLDSGNGMKLERFGKYILSRPDPQAIWKRKLPQTKWADTDAYFKRIKEDRGIWHRKKHLPDMWIMSWNDLSFYVKLTPFKHTGVFPEQAAQWAWMHERITQTRRQVNVLNLFGYTGIATLACASAGAKVTHVDASKPAIMWARENQKVSGLQNKPIRWIVDDVMKFTQREFRRGERYDAIIMDPPVFGHGPSGQLWKFSEHFPKLLDVCSQVLADKPLFLIINAYAISSSALMLENILGDYVGNLGGTTQAGELTLQEQVGKRLLSTGIFATWSAI